MTEDLEPGRPALEAVFVALVTTTIAAGALVHLLVRLLPPSAAEPAPAATLTVAVACVSLAFAGAQAVLPGPKSAGSAGLAIPMIGAIVLAVRGLDPAAVVSTLFTGVFLTPAAYYVAVRYTRSLRGYARRRPLTALTALVAGGLFVVQALRIVTHLADPAIAWRMF